MKRIWTIIAITAWILLGCSIGILAQTGQNKPVYDPFDPAARPLPPNIYLILDVSGSMSNTPTNRGSDPWGYYTTDQDPDTSGVQLSKGYYVKKAVRTVLTTNAYGARWALFAYNGSNMERQRASSVGAGPNMTVPDDKYQNISLDYNPSSYIAVGNLITNQSRTASGTVTSMSGRTVSVLLTDQNKKFAAGDTFNFWGYLFKVRSVSTGNTPFWAFGQSNCGEIRHLLEGVVYDADWHGSELLYKSCLDGSPVDNRSSIMEWVDSKYPSAAAPTQGVIQPPGWDAPFVKELIFDGNTPIEGTYETIKRYIYGDNSGADVVFYDYEGGGYDSAAKLTGLDPFIKADNTSCRYQAIVLLTDGMDTCQGDPVGKSSAMKSSYDVDTFVIGFSSQSSGEKDTLDRIANMGLSDPATPGNPYGRHHPYFADNDSSLTQAFNDIMYAMTSPEMSGDTEPILGFIANGEGMSFTNMPSNDKWPSFTTVGNQTVTIGVQNVVVKASTAYSPVFQGHVRLFQALKTHTGDDKKIDFLTDFGRYAAGTTTPNPNMKWDAADVLTDRIGATQNIVPRVIYTTDGSGLFDINASDGLSRFTTLAGLATADNAATTDRNESASAFRDWINHQPLGAITYSTPAFVGPPDPRTHPSDSSYVTFAKTDANATRTKVVIVGANDGMLHCFKAINGDELWAFIPGEFLGTGSAPGTLYDGLYGKGIPSQMGQPNVFGVRGEVIANRKPHYYGISSSPRVVDAKVNGSWKTLCLFGLGGGGRKYFCLDITDPTNPSVLWTFSDSGLGETWSVPGMGTLADGTCIAAVGSGFNMTSNSTAGQTFYILNAANGSVLYSYNVGGGTTNTAPPDSNPSHAHLVSAVGNCIFSSPTMYTRPSKVHEYVDRIYFSDYEGGVYSVNLENVRSNSSTDWGTVSCTKIFQGTSPIYSGVYASELTIGAGKPKTFLAFSEYGNAVDASISGGAASNGAFYTLVEDNLPSALPLERSNLKNPTATGGTDFDPTSDPGFYYQYGSSETGVTGTCTGLARPAIFNGVASDGTKQFWVGASSYEFRDTVNSYSCDADTRAMRALSMGLSRSYQFDMTTGNYFNSKTYSVSDLSKYGRASSWHKGLRGEGWIDSGSGETYGFGYSKTNKRFRKFGSDADNVVYDLNPVSMRINRAYWREMR